MEEIWRTKRESDRSEGSTIIFREKVNISHYQREAEREKKRDRDRARMVREVEDSMSWELILFISILCSILKLTNKCKHFLVV